jgi:hypothetical protein
MAYREFQAELFSGLKQSPFKLKDTVLQNSDTTVSWLWLTTAKDQGKNLPTLNALAREEHYEAICAKVAETALKNKKLSNVILRIHVELKAITVDDGGEENGDVPDEGLYGRSVPAGTISWPDCRLPPIVKKKAWPVFQSHIYPFVMKNYGTTCCAVCTKPIVGVGSLQSPHLMEKHVFHLMLTM